MIESGSKLRTREKKKWGSQRGGPPLPILCLHRKSRGLCVSCSAGWGSQCTTDDAFSPDEGTCDMVFVVAFSWMVTVSYIGGLMSDLLRTSTSSFPPPTIINEVIFLLSLLLLSIANYFLSYQRGSGGHVEQHSSPSHVYGKKIVQKYSK